MESDPGIDVYVLCWNLQWLAGPPFDIEHQRLDKLDVKRHGVGGQRIGLGIFVVDFR